MQVTSTNLCITFLLAGRPTQGCFNVGGPFCREAVLAGGRGVLAGNHPTSQSRGYWSGIVVKGRKTT